MATLGTVKILIQAQAQGLNEAVASVRQSLQAIEQQVAQTQRVSTAAARSAAAMGEFARSTASASAAARKAAVDLASVGQAFRSMQREIQQAKQEMVDLGGIFSTMSTRMGRVIMITLEFGIALSIIQGLTRAVGGWREATVDLNASLELLQVRLTALFGSAEKANQMIAYLVDLAARSPYGVMDLAKAVGYLAAAGAPLESIPRMLNAIVANVAALGGTRDTLDRVTYALFQMAQAGRVTAQDMRQLTEAGIPAWQILADALGVSIDQAMKMVEERLVASQTFFQAFVSWAEQRHGDLANSLLTTWAGATEALRDAIDFATAQAFRPLFDALRQAVVEVARFAGSDSFMVEWAARVNGAVQVVVDGLVGFVGILRSVLMEAWSVAVTIGQAIYEALQWINPFARHSPSLVEDVENGVDAIIDAFDDLDAIDDAMDDIRRQIRDLQRQLRTLGIELRGVERALRQARDLLDEYRDNLRRVEDRIREVEDAIRDLARATLVEELPYLEQLAQYDRRLKELRLQKLRLEFAGAPAAFIDEIEAQLEILQKRAEMVDLERELNIGPLREQLQRAADDALGLNQALSFGEAISRIAELTAELVELRQEQAYWQDMVRQQEAVVAALEEQADALRNAMDELRNAIDELRNQLAQYQNAADRAKDATEKLKVPAIGLAGAFSILRREIQDVATTPFVVDTSGLDELQRRAAQAEAVLVDVAQTLETIVPGATSKSLLDIRELAKELERAGNQSDAFRKSVDRFGKTLDDARFALRQQQDVLREYEKLLRDVERAIRETERAIRDLTEVPLAEEQPYIEQLKEIEKQIKQLELRKMELILAGAPDEEIEAIENQIRRLEAQARKVDLERELAIEPLREQLRETADQALGTGKVLTFEEAMTAMQRHIENLKTLREQQKLLVELTEKQRDAVEEWSQKVEALSSVYDALRDSIQRASKATAGAAQGAEGGWPLGDPKVFEQAEERLSRFQAIASETRKRVSEFLAPIAPALRVVGELVARFATTLAVAGAAFGAFLVATAPLRTLFVRLRAELLPFVTYVQLLAQAFRIDLTRGIGTAAGVLGQLVGIVSTVAGGVATAFGAIVGAGASLVSFFVTLPVKVVGGLFRIVQGAAAVANALMSIAKAAGALGGLFSSLSGLQKGLNALVTIGSSLATIFGTIRSGWTALFGALASGASGIIGVFTQLGQGVLAVAAGFSRLIGMGLALLNPVKLLTAAVGGLRAGLLALQAPILLLTGSFRALFGGFFGLVNAITLVWQAFSSNWFGIRDIFLPVVQDILKGLQDIQNAFSQGGLAKGLETLFSVGGQLVQRIAGAFGELGQNIIEAIGRVDWGAVWDAIATGLGAAAGALQKIGAAIVDWFIDVDWSAVGQSVLDKLSTALGALGGGIVRLGEWIWNAIETTDWNAVAQGIADFLTAAWETIVTGAEKVGGWLLSTFEKIDWQKVAETATDLLVGAWTVVGKIGEAVGKWFDEVDWGSVADRVADALLSALEGVASGAEKLLNWVGKLVESVDWAEAGRSVAEALVDAWTAAVEFADKVVTWIMDLVGGIDWTRVGEKLREGFKKAMDFARGALSAASGTETAQPAPAPVADLGPVSQALSTISGAIGPVLQTFREIGSIVWQILGPGFSELGKALGEVVAIVRDQLGPTWDQLKETFNAVAPILGGIAAVVGGALLLGLRGFLEVLSLLLPLATELFFTVFRTALQIIEGVAKVITGIFTALYGLITGDGEKFKEGLRRIWEGIRDIAIGAVQGLFQGITGIFQRIWDWIVGIVTRLYNWLVGQSIIPDLVEKIIALFNGLWTKLQEIWNTIKQAVEAAWNFVKDTIVDRVLTAKDKALEFIGELRDRAGEIWNAIKTKVTEIWQGIYDWISDKVGAVKRTAVDVITEARNTLSTLWDEIYNKATTIWNQLQTAFENTKQAIFNALKWPFESLRDAVGGIMDEAYRLAVGPINALINGINTMGRAVASALRWIGEKLGIGFLQGIFWNDIGQLPTSTGGGGRGGGGVRAYAEGTDFHPGGLALVGEEGPELVWLPRGARVYPAETTQQFLAQAVDAPGFAPRAVGGFLDTVVGAVTSIVGAAADTLLDWIEKGASWVVQQLEGFFQIDTTGWAGSILATVRATILDWLRSFVSDLLKRLEEKVDDRWYKPLLNYVVTQEFGMTDYARSGAYGGAPHTGIDLAAPRGTPVYAARRGTVTFAGWNQYGYGNLVILAHRDDFQTFYGHLEKILVSVGQTVAGGKQIATVDSTGYSTGDHLHFEIRHHGVPVDPRRYIAFAQGGWIREPVIGAGLFSGSRYLFGERGPEYVVPARELGELRAIGGTIEVAVNFNGPVTIHASDEDETKRLVHDIGYLIAQELRRRGLR